MINSVSLRVKCPLCGKSLMDEAKQIDAKPSLKLDVTIGDRHGEIWLSSIYGSYNFESEIEVQQGEVAEFHCPHCKGHLWSKENCYACHAPLVSFHLVEGGKVSICSRAGCEKHAIEFEDLDVALKHFYEDFAYSGHNASITKDAKGRAKVELTKQGDDERDIIESGTFLHAFCPHCKKSLNEHDLLKFKVVKNDGEFGYMMLSPYLNVFTRKSTIQLPDEEVVKDITCWHCDSSLMEEEETCPRCGSKVVKITVAAMSRMVDFYICSKQGCTWHGLSNEDLKHIILEDSEEW